MKVHKARRASMEQISNNFEGRCGAHSRIFDIMSARRARPKNEWQLNASPCAVRGLSGGGVCPRRHSRCDTDQPIPVLSRAFVSILAVTASVRPALDDKIWIRFRRAT